MRASGQIHCNALLLSKKKNHTFATNNSGNGKTPKKGYSSPSPFFPAPFSHRTHLLPPTGYFAPSVFHSNASYQQKEKEADLLVAKQINRWWGENKPNSWITPQRCLCVTKSRGKETSETFCPWHEQLPSQKKSCPSGLILLPTTVGKPITWPTGVLLSLRKLCQNY